MILILGKVVQYYAMQMRGRGAARKEELVPVHPPKNIVGMLIDKMYWQQVPDCIGIINSPTMRSDGSLLTQPGLDAQTGLYVFWPDDLQLPDSDLPEHPTKANAEAALICLQELIVECAFDKKKRN